MFGIWAVISTSQQWLGLGTLSRLVKGATRGVAVVGALPLGLHAAEASHVSASSRPAIRAAIVRSVWSSKMPLANTAVWSGWSRPCLLCHMEWVPHDAQILGSMA